MASVGTQEAKINEIRQQTGSTPLALTESHFTIRGRNRGDLHSTWAVGVAYARFQNLYQRHGDVLRIANKIGRASCRERVCQYVAYSGVAVYLKKKQNHT